MAVISPQKGLQNNYKVGCKKTYHGREITKGSVKMCVICVSSKGAKQPSAETIRKMFEANPHSAGYMYARNNKVVIHKGYKAIEELMADLEYENFTENDVVVYHFRIATQANRIEMSQPFPITRNIDDLEELDIVTDKGLAHNGILSQTSNGDKELSDTAIYIRRYIAGREITSEFVNNLAEDTEGSRLAILEGDGNFHLTGTWTYENGLYYSNENWKHASKSYAYYHRYGERSYEW